VINEKHITYSLTETKIREGSCFIYFLFIRRGRGREYPTEINM
jgi:hypothetical protein